jgi:hypothetical protein
MAARYPPNKSGVEHMVTPNKVETVRDLRDKDANPYGMLAQNQTEPNQFTQKEINPSKFDAPVTQPRIYWIREYLSNVDEAHMKEWFRRADDERKGNLSKQQFLGAIRMHNELAHMNSNVFVDMMFAMVEATQHVGLNEFMEIWGFMNSLKRTWQGMGREYVNMDELSNILKFESPALWNLLQDKDYKQHIGKFLDLMQVNLNVGGLDHRQFLLLCLFLGTCLTWKEHGRPINDFIDNVAANIFKAK